MSRSSSADHELRPNSDCIRYGRSGPACSQSNQPVLRSALDSRPSMKLDAVSRSSDLENTRPMRSFNAASSASQASKDPDQSATISPSRIIGKGITVHHQTQL